MAIKTDILLQDPRVQKLKLAVSDAAELFLVGGCVRDFICGSSIKDLDFTCRLPAQDLLQILCSQGLRCIETGVRHGTITVVIDDSNLEITSFRGPQSQELSLRQSLEVDLSLRDFTINSIAISINSGEIIDPLNGSADIKSKTLRACPPELEIFKLDPLRIMRMLRFGHANNYAVCEKTLTAAKTALPLIKAVSIERIQHEFSKILLSSNPRAAIVAMQDLGLLEMYFPEALPSINFEQNEFHTEDVFNHTLSVIEKTPEDLTMRLAAFFHDLGKPQSLSVDQQGNRHFYDHERFSAEICKLVMQRLRYSNDLTESVCNIVKYHMRPVECGPSGIRRLIRDLGSEFEQWRKFKEADHTPSIAIDKTLQALAEFDNKVKAEYERAALEKQKKLVIDGHTLMELGLNAGPELGRIIKLLEEEVIEEPTRNNKEYLINKAKEFITKKTV